MLRLEDYKIIFVAVGLIGVLVFASPTLGLVLHLPSGEKFSELYVLGSGHMAEDYPFNVKAGENHSVYLGVVNDMGSSAYYKVFVKFRNQTEPLPNSTAGIPSPLEPLFEYRAFLENGRSWEEPLTFSFSDVSFSEGQCQVQTMIVNGANCEVQKRAQWDAENSGFYYQLFIELWFHNVELQTFQFHNRFVHFWLNMTGTV